MTYFETPADRDAFLMGVSVDDYLTRQDREVEDLEALDAANRPDLAVERRPLVAEQDVETVTPQDRADLEMILDWEAHEGFGG